MYFCALSIAIQTNSYWIVNDTFVSINRLYLHLISPESLLWFKRYRVIIYDTTNVKT